jgi:RNA polymerase sigma-70 factor (ECF subfamily)
VQAGDRLDQLTAGRPRLEADVVELRRQGLTFEEIARRLGTSDRAVRRVLEAIRRRLEKEDERWR